MRYYGWFNDILMISSVGKIIFHISFISHAYVWFTLITHFMLGTDHLTCREGGYGFLFRSEFFFSDNTRVKILFFFVEKHEFFFKNLTLGYMTKTLNHIIVFFLHQNQNIFFSNIENQNIYLEKNHNPPPSFKLNGSSPSFHLYVSSEKTVITTAHFIFKQWYKLKVDLFCLSTKISKSAELAMLVK